LADLVKGGLQADVWIDKYVRVDRRYKGIALIDSKGELPLSGYAEQ